MAAIIGNLSGRVLIQFDGQEPIEVGRVDMPITAPIKREADRVVVNFSSNIDPADLQARVERAGAAFNGIL